MGNLSQSNPPLKSGPPEFVRSDQTSLGKRTRGTINTVLSFLVYLGWPFLIFLGGPLALVVVVGIGVSSFLIVVCADVLDKRRAHRAVCIHGVKGGGLGSCQVCLRSAELWRENAQHEYELRQLQKLNRDNALALRDREIKRLSAAWLTEANSYLRMTPRQFEDAIAELFKRLGYKVQQTPFSSDGGKDAIAWKDNKKVLIECKRFADDRSVGRRDIQIFHSAVVDAKADEGFFVTTGSYAHTAVKYAQDNKITIYDRNAIPWLVTQAYGSSHDYSKAEVMCYQCGLTIFLPLGETTPSGRCENLHEVLMNITLADLGVAHIYKASTPTCPRCGVSMRKIEKIGRRPFWGCSDFPKCSGTTRFVKAR